MSTRPLLSALLGRPSLFAPRDRLSIVGARSAAVATTRGHRPPIIPCSVLVRPPCPLSTLAPLSAPLMRQRRPILLPPTSPWSSQRRTFLKFLTPLSSNRSKASAAPQDTNAQLVLFKQLLQLNTVANAKELSDRYEELTGLFGAKADTEPLNKDLIKDDEAFKMYLVSLARQSTEVQGSESAKAAQSMSKIAEAPTKRAALLTQVGGLNTPEAATASTPLQSSAVSTVSTDQPTLSPTTLITALFSGSKERGKGGEAKIASAGSYGSSGITVNPSEPIRVIVEESKTPMFIRAVRFTLVTILYSFLLLSLLSLLLDSSGILRATTPTSPFQPTTPPDPNNTGGRGTTFKDVHGVEEAKEELYEIVEFLKDPKRFEKLGGRLPRGVLLTGPPGTGKTLLARAVAGEAGVNFFSASGAEFDEMYVGVGARRIRELFAAARKAAPAIIFIDEIDAVGGKRSPRDQHYVKQTLNQLLVEMDGFNPGEGVILIGATNFPESLDKALIRPGRFDRHVVVPLPDVRGRMQILTHHMRNIGYDKAGVDISIIARGTTGFSGADLQALVNQAAVKASADGATAVRASHFEWAKERIMMGAARKSAYITEKDKLGTAYHEGGHALVALYTQGAYPLQSITVVPRGMALGYTLLIPEMDKTSHSLREYLARLDVSMGGRIAEEIVYGKQNVTDGASSDISNATTIARNMVTRFGFSDVIGPVAHTGDPDQPVSPETQAAIDSEIKTLIENAQERAKALLLSKRDELDRLAQALMEHETLDLSEVKKIIKGEKIVRAALDE